MAKDSHILSTKNNLQTNGVFVIFMVEILTMSLILYNWAQMFRILN